MTVRSECEVCTKERHWSFSCGENAERFEHGFRSGDIYRFVACLGILGNQVCKLKKVSCRAVDNSINPSTADLVDDDSRARVLIRKYRVDCSTDPKDFSSVQGLCLINVCAF